MVSSDERYPKHRVEVRGLEMAYVDVGVGDPIVFIHGNPSSSYEWRSVIPHLTSSGRCIAPDLIGMGDSDKLLSGGRDAYRFVEHRDYLDGFLEALDLRERITFVLRDWGSALGFDWAYRHPAAVSAIAYMEAFVAPTTSWADWPDAAVEVFQTIRSEAGEDLVLGQNFVVERLLPAEVLRTLSDAEMAEYRRPFLEPGESRRPTLTWPREVPVGGEPRDVHDTINRYAGWLAVADLPKLFVEAVPGAMFESHRELARSWPHQAHRIVRAGHLVPADAPDDVGSVIASWLAASR